MNSVLVYTNSRVPLRWFRTCTVRVQQQRRLGVFFVRTFYHMDSQTYDCSRYLVVVGDTAVMRNRCKLIITNWHNICWADDKSPRLQEVWCPQRTSVREVEFFVCYVQERVTWCKWVPNLVNSLMVTPSILGTECLWTFTIVLPWNNTFDPASLSLKR